MGVDASSGLANHKCLVFRQSSDTGGEAVRPGLYVCDGSIMPRSLGVNPLLSITALAERAMVLLAQDKGWRAGKKTGQHELIPAE